MMFSHTVTTTETPVEVHTVTYRHDYGTDTTVYATKELAYKAACKIISNWIEELEEHESLADLVSLINTGKYVKALVLWSQMIADFDIVEEIKNFDGTNTSVYLRYAPCLFSSWSKTVTVGTTIVTESATIQVGNVTKLDSLN